MKFQATNIEILAKRIEENLPSGYTSVKISKDSEYVFELTASALLKNHFIIITAKISDKKVKMFADWNGVKELEFTSKYNRGQDKADQIYNLFQQVYNFISLSI